MEVLAIGMVEYEALIPCFVAAFAGDLTTRGWHIQHTLYRVAEIPAVSVGGLLCAAAAGAAFGLVAMAFARSTHELSAAFKRRFSFGPLRPLFGGIAVFAAGTTKYIGLGIPGIQAAFTERLPWYDWAGKFAFTTVTLGAGFKGGEVTPLFFIGATLGNALSQVLPLPPSLLAGMGFVAVFAGAANTPLASTLMAVELFGGEVGAYAGVACAFSYLFSGHHGIYSAQRLGRGKIAQR
jgi:H+/Cl- antiporter ClcA